jgi:thiol-disulfide isomerase/thioredoxin
MKNIILCIVLLSLISCDRIPEKIIIPMENEIIESPFPGTALAPRPNRLDTISMEGISNDLRNVDIRKISFQREHSGEIKQDVFFFVGETDDKIVVKIDANNNQTFEDDEALEFKKNIEPSDNELFQDDLPVVIVNYEYLKGNERFNLKTALKVSPYDKSVVRIKKENEWVDPFEDEIVITFYETDYKKAEIEINRKRYQVALHGFRNKYKTEAENTELIIIEKGKEMVPTYLGYVPIKFGEEFILGDLKYQFSDVTDFGDTLRLDYMGKVTEDKPIGVNVGLYATDFQKPTVDLKLFQLSNCKGKYVLIDFWGTWCKPCIASLPKLKKIHSMYADKGLTMLSVAYDDNLEKVKQGISEHDLTWNNIYQNAQDTSQYALTKLFNVHAFPTLLLIDPDGKIIFRLSGNYPDKYEELFTLLDETYR